MAQQVVIAGALFNDVPSISVPDSNNVYHPFFDTTITSNAAVAGDIAQGKLAYVNGSLVTGTNQGGGGGGTLKVGALRPDAALVQSWTYDKKIVADEHVTIPAYTTSATSLKAGVNIATNVQLDLSQYDYIVTERGLSIPVYSTGTLGAARQVYSMFNCAFEVYCVPRTAVSVEGKSPAGYLISTNAYPAYYTNVYWNSATIVNQNTTNYGAYQTYPTPSLTVTSTTNGTATYTIKSPSFYIRGSNNNMNSIYWGYLTDIRFQYVIELWKVPRTSSVYGFTVTSQIRHTIECAQSANGTLS